MLENLNLFFSDWSNNTGAIDLKKEKSSVKMLGLTVSSKLDWGSYIISIAKIHSRKVKSSFILWRFFLWRSVNLPYGLVWNNVFMSGLVLVAAAWEC